MALEKYSKIKIHISIDTKLLKKIDKIKEYPEWEGNRSKIIKKALEEFLEKK